jgi:molecular chaperone GrpE (heat shock protein)
MSVDDESPSNGPAASPGEAPTPPFAGNGAEGVNTTDSSPPIIDREPPTSSTDRGFTDAAAGGAAVTSDELAAMANALERFHGRAEQYEAIIRGMQSRIEELQADQVRELLKPVIVRLAALHTEATDAELRASTREDDSARKDFDFFASEIEESLGLLDIESINVSALDEFDPAKHAARRRIATDDPTLDKRIAKVSRQGFSYVGAARVFIPAEVNVYRFEPSTAAASAVDGEHASPTTSTDRAD